MTTPKKAKGRANVKAFVQLYQDLLWHPNYLKLTHRAVRLLNDLFAHYNGGNNGDLSACRTLMKVRGWTSGSSLDYALQELLYYEFVKVSRHGGRNRPTLLALTCFPIDECKGKHDLRPTVAATNEYKVTKKQWQNPRRKQKRYPTGGSTYPTGGSMNVVNLSTNPRVGQWRP
ncbi:MAG: hypothetical protein H6995_14540 [Pseudomonadales bacterium]|nr:hypothetical protein [Pseudomonadales bacterium]MCP5216216.1 hypothetical protein [Pseudomonadales bacterium]